MELVYLRMQHIQPFELLGVTFSTSLKDVRKRYYQLALLCHPDKGGSAEDMRMLHVAYKWIEEQLLTVQSQEFQSYEEAEESFQAFVEERKSTEVLPSMMEVALDVSGYCKQDISAYFVQHAPSTLQAHPTALSWFEQMVLRDIYLASLRIEEVTFDTICSEVLRGMSSSWETLQPASIPGGYGEYMVTPCMDEETAPPSLGVHQMVLFKEQQPYQKGPCGAQYGNVPATLENYGEGPHGCDYREAFLEHVPEQTFEAAAASICTAYSEPLGSVEEKLEDIQLQRQMFDHSLEERPNRSVTLTFAHPTS